jgi:Cu(I)/Ag(I) efflux system membrane fusion protein
MKRYWRRNKPVGSRHPNNYREAVSKVRRDFLRLAPNCLLLTAYFLLSSCSQNKKQVQADTYTCLMHPTVLQDKPGTCPVCGMGLVLKGRAGDEAKITHELNYLLKPVNAAVISFIKTVTPTLKSMEIKTKADGIITYDTRALTAISSRFNGRIEKLFVKYNFQPIRKGQRILEIYSPDLLTAQRDLLYLLKSDKENAQLIDGATERLKLLGVSDDQINQLISLGKESNSFSVYSHAAGYVINSGENLKNQNELEVREGMYVAAGQVIFKVANPKNVWAEFDLFSKDVASVKVNDPVQIKIEETAEELHSKINFLQPFYKEAQSFTKVRVYLSNSNSKYRIGQLVSASFSKPSPESLWIPLSAHSDLGTRKIVFVKHEGMFQPREISTGSQSGMWIEVLKGININDSLAYNAQFMIDSESFIKIEN